MTARLPPRWALLRVSAALAAQQYGARSRVDIGALARRVGLSRGLTAACVRAAAAAPHAAVPTTSAMPAAGPRTRGN
ncbi:MULTISPECIES: hypothetical protein [unclassified Streptomyces]|uniref:hypothetical protein n=1 Tax=unclassified Streptomyces TaxID=2593676 RepID=UPI0036E1A833